MSDLPRPIFAVPQFYRSLGALVCVALLTGCVMTPYQRNPAGAGLPPAILLAQPTKLTAVGYGNMGRYSQYTNGQQKLLAIRAAQVDAYRNLAEQLQGFRIAGNTSVATFATQHDTSRLSVDAFLRGARVVNTTAAADGNYEVTVELDLAPNLRQCLQEGMTSAGCVELVTVDTALPATTPGAVSANSCKTFGCAAPSVDYHSQ
jgi:hypothetical protein